MSTTKNITRTILGSIISSYALLDKDLRIYKNSTLNEKWGLPVGSIDGKVPAGKKVSIKCLVAGYGGHGLSMGADSVTPVPYTKQHRSTDFALFKHMPFAMKELATEDPVFENRNKYCLRTIVRVNGIDYAAYYGLRIDTSVIEPVINKFHIENDQIISTVPIAPASPGNGGTPYTFDPEWLAPLAPDLPVDDVSISNAEVINISSLIQTVFTKEVSDEYRNAAYVIFNSTDMAVVSELGIVTGFNEALPEVASGYQELRAAQIISHLTCFQSLTSDNSGFTTTIDIGATEPLLATSTV